MIQVRLGCNVQYAGMVQSQLSGEPCIFDTEANGVSFTRATVQVDITDVAFGATVLEVKQGNTQSGPFYSFASPVTFSAAGISAPITIGSKFLAVECTTGAGSQVRLNVNVFMRTGE